MMVSESLQNYLQNPFYIVYTSLEQHRNVDYHGLAGIYWLTNYYHFNHSEEKRKAVYSWVWNCPLWQHLHNYGIGFKNHKRKWGWQVKRGYWIHL